MEVEWRDGAEPVMRYGNDGYMSTTTAALMASSRVHQHLLLLLLLLRRRRRMPRPLCEIEVPIVTATPSGTSEAKRNDGAMQHGGDAHGAPT